MTHNTAGETAGVTAGPSHVAILPTPAVNGTDNTGLTDMDIKTPKRDQETEGSWTSDLARLHLSTPTES